MPWGWWLMGNEICGTKLIEHENFSKTYFRKYELLFVHVVNMELRLNAIQKTDLAKKAKIEYCHLKNMLSGRRGCPIQQRRKIVMALGDLINAKKFIYEKKKRG